MHPKHARSAGGSDQLAVLAGAEFLRHDQLNDQVVFDFDAGRGLDVADGFEFGVAGEGGFEFHVDLSSDGVEIALPARLHFVGAQDPRLGMQDGLSLADFVSMLRARRRDDFAVLLDPPREFPQPPPGLTVALLLHNPAQGHGDGERANGVDDGW